MYYSSADAPSICSSVGVADAAGVSVACTASDAAGTPGAGCCACIKSLPSVAGACGTSSPPHALNANTITLVTAILAKFFIAFSMLLKTAYPASLSKFQLKESVSSFVHLIPAIMNSFLALQVNVP
jgi:hypothetical protein